MSAGLHARCNREIGGVLHKRCTRCQEWKPRVAAFRPKPRKGMAPHANVHSWCRPCEALNSQVWHKENYRSQKREPRERPDLNASGSTLAAVWR